ncbi:MAG: SWIM zinc finger family protein [Verrucomicrobiota bacterium]
MAEKRRRSEKEAAKLTKKGQTLAPVRLESKTIARSFWGKSWCANLESYSDFSNRMPRGRSYVRNGSVLHLDIRQGEIEALVSGSSLYKILVKIKPEDTQRWSALCRAAAGSIGSLMELLQGKLSERVMGIMTHRETGLFPAPQEIELDCSCPDWADMCKHVAAVLYGVGARLDEKPELLFLLRHVDHQELVSQADSIAALTETKTGAILPTLSEKDVESVFGIELEAGAAAATASPAPAPRRARRKAAKKKLMQAVRGKIKKAKKKATPIRGSGSGSRA